VNLLDDKNPSMSNTTLREGSAKGHCVAPWKSKDKRDFLSLTAAIAAVGIALGMLLPLTSLKLNALGYSSSAIGMSIAVHALGLVLAALIGERSTQSLGAKRTIEMFSLASAIMSLLMGTLMMTLFEGPGLIVCLFALGLFLGVVLNMVETWVNEVISEARRGQMLAVHCTIFTLCQLLGPVLVDAIPLAYGYETCAALMLVTWPAYTFLTDRSIGEEGHGDATKETWFKLLLGAPTIVLSTALFALFDTVILSLLPIYSMALGMSQQGALASCSVVLAGDAALEIAVGTLADKFGRLLIHRLCAVTLFICASAIPFVIGTLLWWPVLFVMGGAAGSIYVLSMMASGQAFTGKKLMRMTALMGSVWGAASIVGPLSTGWLMEFNAAWSLPSVLLAITTALFVALAFEKSNQTQKSPEIQTKQVSM
jgi:MFS family permease